MKRYKRRVISKSDWVGLRLLFMGSAVEMSLINVEDWKKCQWYYIDKYGVDTVYKALDILFMDYKDGDAFRLSNLAWGDAITISHSGDKDKQEVRV